MESVTSYTIATLSAGVVLGLSAGLSPGPLLALVITQTLRHGVGEGVKVALAPLITDLPIIMAATFLLTQLSNSQPVLGFISLVGGLFLTYLAYENLRANRVDSGITASVPKSFTKGALVNFLSPHPYLFWLTVGSPFMVKAWLKSPMAAIGFVATFYAGLIGSKMAVAVVSGKSRQFIQGKIYRIIMRFLGVVLLIFAFWLFKEGIHSIGF
jgi:threonine/homoserine/homoserine lactone efflux protein